ncbi:MAG: LysR family transcriptional regulator [Candidatus Latescibacteria bacterium]|jgi:DNA-binding transcriptional LysR family regulator|nr:LysR family transcriptional regulator [Candidatus Latescibacterota bacterium]
MDLYQLRGFYEIVREQSFTRAADKLFLTQPAISLQVKALERELDEILLERNRRQIRLTPAGEILFAHAREVFARLASARDEIAALKKVLRGRLAIGTSDTNCTYILPGLLAEFRARYPEVELDIRNRMSPEVGNLVLNDEVEFGLATLPVKHRDLVGEVLFARRDVLICPPDHALAARRRIGLKQIVAHPFLALERGSTSRQLLDEVCRHEGLELQVEMNLGGIEIIKRYVEIGLGIALVPEVAVEDEVAAGRLCTVRVMGLGKREIGLVEHRGRRRSQATGAFLGLLREFVGEGRI